MKTLLFIFSFFFICGNALPQKPTQSIKSEMQQQVAEIKKEIADLEEEIEKTKVKDPEGAKEMEQQLAMFKKLLASMQGASKVVEKTSDQKLQQVMDDETRLVPRLDAARIATIPKKILNASELNIFVNKTVLAVNEKLSAKSKQNALAIYKEVKTKNTNHNDVANAANGCWMSGFVQEAIYLAGKACTESPGDAGNLNNYAAFLTMSGAEQNAIPILQNLNQQFPNNSTILNNLGQAWFGLGEEKSAKKYLDSAIRFFATHSQANFTMCAILESEGDMAGAAFCLRQSIRQAYSQTKEQKAKELKLDLKKEDVTWLFPIPKDPLGLNKFKIPEYSNSVEDAERTSAVWNNFQEAASDRSSQLNEKGNKLTDSLTVEQEKLSQERMNAVSTGKFNMRIAAPPYLHKASLYLKLHYGVTTPQQLISMAEAKNPQHQKRMIEVDDKMTKEYGERVASINKRGENDLVVDLCPDLNAAANDYIKVNNFLRTEQDALLKEYKEALNTAIYFELYTSISNTMFEREKANAIKEYMGLLANLRHRTITKCNGAKEKKTDSTGKLPDYDDITCKTETNIYLFPVVKYNFRCNKMTTTFNFAIFEGMIKEDLNTNKIIRGEVEVGIFKELGAIKDVPPLAAEIKLASGISFEFDNDGLTDVAFKTGITAELGVDMPTPIEVSKGHEISIGDWPSAEAGIGVKWGWNAGGSIEGKGLLTGLSSSSPKE